MGVGFALARFGLYLREFQGEKPAAPHPTGLSVYSGVALVTLGVIVNVVAVIHHVGTVKQCETAHGFRAAPPVVPSSWLCFWP